MKKTGEERVQVGLRGPVLDVSWDEREKSESRDTAAASAVLYFSVLGGRLGS
jgi:hypothetical protein